MLLSICSYILMYNRNKSLLSIFSPLDAARSFILGLKVLLQDNVPLKMAAWAVHDQTHLVLYGSHRVVCFGVMKQELRGKQRKSVTRFHWETLKKFWIEILTLLKTFWICSYVKAEEKSFQLNVLNSQLFVYKAKHHGTWRNYFFPYRKLFILGLFGASQPLAWVKYELYRQSLLSS